MTASETEAVCEHYRTAGRAELERIRDFVQCDLCFGWHASGTDCPTCVARALRLRILWHEHLIGRADMFSRVSSQFVLAHADGCGEWFLGRAAAAAECSNLYRHWATDVLAPGTREIVNAAG